MTKKLLSMLPDSLLVIGASSVSFGAWLVHQPSGFVVAGVFLLAGGWILSKAAK